MDEQEVIRRYIGLEHAASIARSLKVSNNKIFGILRRHNIEIRDRKAAMTLHYRTEDRIKTEDAMLVDYYAGMTAVDIEKLHGFDSDAIRRVRTRRNLKARRVLRGLELREQWRARQ